MATSLKILSSIILGGCLSAATSSCVKQTETAPPPTDSSTNLITGPTASLLTGPTWVYYEYFTSYDSTNVSLAWKTNRTSNALNLAKDQVKFNPNGTYSEIDQNGNTLNGTWKFLNNETQTQVVNSEGTFVYTIQKLTSGRYEWLAPNGTYGIMVPIDATSDTSGGRMQLLTARSWVYDEYFYNFNYTVPQAPQLVWKTNLSNAPFNLSLNFVKWNPDGTYTETDQNGNVFNGTWQFLNNMTGTATTNIEGTFYATITRLDTARLEWYDNINTYHYGEMVHP